MKWGYHQHLKSSRQLWCYRNTETFKRWWAVRWRQALFHFFVHHAYDILDCLYLIRRVNLIHQHSIQHLKFRIFAQPSALCAVLFFAYLRQWTGTVKSSHNDIFYNNMPCIMIVSLLTVRFCIGPMERGPTHDDEIFQAWKSYSDTIAHTCCHHVVLYCMHAWGCCRPYAANRGTEHACPLLTRLLAHGPQVKVTPAFGNRSLHHLHFLVWKDRLLRSACNW